MARTPERIEDDQWIEGIDHIDDTIRSEEGRKHFITQLLSGAIDYGVYNSISGRIERSHGETLPVFDDTSVGTFTLTCPANRIYKVSMYAIMNGTRAGTWQLQYFNARTGVTIDLANGGTLTVAATVLGYLVGGVSPNGAVGAVPGFSGPVSMYPGDTLTDTNANFQAADTTERHILIEEIVLTRG